MKESPLSQRSTTLTPGLHSERTSCSASEVGFQKKKFQHFPYQPSEKHQIIPGNQKAKRHRKRYKIDQFKIETM